MVNKLSRKWVMLSILCLLLGIVAWLPSFIHLLGIESWFPSFMHFKRVGYWLFTLIINPIGAFCGYKGKSTFGIISNALMTVSFFILMFIGYLVEGILQFIR